MREKIKSSNLDEIKSAKESLQKSMYEISTKLYQKAAQQGATQQGAEGQNQGSQGSENVYNADYKEVDPENK